MTARKGIAPPELLSTSGLVAISDERWAAITSCLPEPLANERSEQLRGAVLDHCSAYLTARSANERAAATAAAMRPPGKRQRANFEQLAQGLRNAANAWAKIGCNIHDDRLSDLRIYDGLEALAVDAARRLSGIRQLGNPVRLEDPWAGFVRGIAASCQNMGLRPTATGRGYEQGKPSWFQAFVVAINDSLLGDLGGRRHGKAAQYAKIAQALGDVKPGKAQT